MVVIKNLFLSISAKFSSSRLVLLCVFSMVVFSPLTYAFKPGIHDDATRTELSNAGFDEDSADEVADSNFYTDIAEPSNAAAHADNNQLGAASARLTSKRNTVATQLATCERRAALDAFGEALHTVQDIYSHSNAVDNGHAIPDLLSIPNGSAACTPVGRAFAPAGLVTGYFSLSGYLVFNDQCLGIPASNCCHIDLNKDDAGELNGARHSAALTAARGATRQYLNLVKDYIRANNSSDSAAQLIKMLERKQRHHYFVIDDTGSMSDDIAGVQAAVNSYLDSLVASDEAPTLGLVTFKDSPTVFGNFCDLTQFRARINAISAGGGGDCPEGSNVAMLAALQRFPSINSDIQLKGGRILLATDASAGDAFLGPQVVATATQRGVSIDAILTGDCIPETGLAPTLSSALTTASQNDPTQFSAAVAPAAAVAPVVADPLTSPSARTQLRALTAQTGGILFQVTRSEVQSIVPTLIELGDPNSATFVTRRGTVSAVAPVVYTIPVDDTVVNKITFVVALTRAGVLPALTITRPDGSTVAVGDSDVEHLLLSSVDSYALNKPATGLWQIRLTGDASIAFRAAGTSALDINTIRFVNLAPVDVRPEVEFVPIEGQPIIGSTVTADLRLTAHPNVSQVRVVREDGSLIQTLLPTTTDKRYFRISFVVPAERFLLEVEGTTASGSTFVRQIAVPVVPQTVAINALPKTQNTLPGTNAIIKVTVRNVSAVDATFNLSALSSLGWVATVPAPFTVLAGGSVTMDVSVAVPVDALDGTTSNVSLTVTDVASPATRNTTQATVTAVTNRPPLCDSAIATPSVLTPDRRLQKIAIDGVTDPDGEVPTILVTGITQDEPVVGREDDGGKTAPDGKGVGTATPSVRAERNDEGDGRVYRIAFSASDSLGESCTGSVEVSVPKNKRRPAVDSGQRYDSTVVPTRSHGEDGHNDD